MTKILPCTCKDEFQDKEYGKGMRVHNIGGKGKEKLAYCTVCSPSRFRTLRYLQMTIEPAPLFGCYSGIFGDRGVMSLKGKPHPGGKPI